MKMEKNKINGLALAQWINKINNMIGLESEIFDILSRVEYLEYLLYQERFNDFTTFIIKKMLYNKADDQIWRHMRVRETHKERVEREKREKYEKEIKEKIEKYGK